VYSPVRVILSVSLSSVRLSLSVSLLVSVLIIASVRLRLVCLRLVCLQGRDGNGPLRAHLFLRSLASAKC